MARCCSAFSSNPTVLPTARNFSQHPASDRRPPGKQTRRFVAPPLVYRRGVYGRGQLRPGGRSALIICDKLTTSRNCRLPSVVCSFLATFLLGFAGWF